MARPSKSELVKRAERTRAAIAAADPKSTAALLKAKQTILGRFARDAGWWYDQARKIVEEGTTRDDEPRVKLVLAALRSFVPEQRTFPAAAESETPKAPMQVNIFLPAGAELERGTVAARDKAIEVRATRVDNLPVVGETAMQSGA